MKLKTIILLLIIYSNLYAESNIKERLNKIEGIKVSEITTKKGFSECFKILIKQPINELTPTQRVGVSE